MNRRVWQFLTVIVALMTLAGCKDRVLWDSNGAYDGVGEQEVWNSNGQVSNGEGRVIWRDTSGQDVIK